MKHQKQNYLTAGLLILIVFVAVNSLIASKIIPRYYSGVITMVCINVILATSLNITVGLLGQINLGHAGFMSVGAYTGALLVKSLPFSGPAAYLVAVSASAVLAFCCGLLVGVPSLRLKGDYLAILTLAFNEIIRVLIEFFPFTGGAQGLSGIPVVHSFPLIFFIMILSVGFMYSLMTSRHGRGVLAIREDEIAAEASGVDTIRAKVTTFAISAAFAGVAGAMYAQYIGVITAGQFGYAYSIDILVMVVLGGMGSFTGSTISAVVLTVLPELLRGFQAYRMIIYSLVLIAVMIHHPQGLLGKKEFQISQLLKYFRIRFRSGKGVKS